MPDSAVTLRPAAPADLGAVRSLLADAQLPLEGLEEQFGERYAVAEADGMVIGAEGVEVYGSFGLLRSAAVAVRHRGTGLGVQLTRNRLDWARARGLSAVYLLTTTAAPFFARLGFRAVARASAPPEVQASREFASVCPASAVCMRLDLP